MAMACVSPRLPPPTSKVPKFPSPKFPKLFPSLIPLALPHYDIQSSNYISTSQDESSLHHYHAKAFSLVSRLGLLRREALLCTFFSAAYFSFLATVSFAMTDLQGSFRAYEDETNKFRIFVPEGWSIGVAETSSIKSVTAFYPKEASNSNVSITITGLGPDFTTLGSFGEVDAFAETLVSGMDRSWQRPPGMAAKLINSEAANGLYYIEYTMQNPGERCRHIFSAIGIASNGWYNRLYTVNGQFIDDEVENYKSLVEKVVLSFRLI